MPAVGRHRLHRRAHGDDRRLALARAHHQLGAVARLAAEQRRRARAPAPRRPRSARARPRRPPAPGPDRPPSRPPGSGARRADRRTPRAAAARPRGSRSASCAAAWRRARASGSSACTITRPPRSPRPLRPASWATSANVRSSARKSGKRSVASASSTTPSVTSGKSWPLATICVPTSTPASAASNARSTPAMPELAATSESSRNTGSGLDQLLQLALELLGAGAVARHRHRPAVRALRRHPRAVAAVVAGELARRPGGAPASRRSRGIPRRVRRAGRRGSSTSRGG